MIGVGRRRIDELGNRSVLGVRWSWFPRLQAFEFRWWGVFSPCFSSVACFSFCGYVSLVFSRFVFGFLVFVGCFAAGTFLWVLDEF